MTFSEMALRRQSCRSYSTQPVEREKLERIIETARITPSACNSQPWHMTVVDGTHMPAFAAALQGNHMNAFATDCPAFIVINEEEMNRSAKRCAETRGLHYASYDIGLLTAHLCYAAQQEGLSTCILGWFDQEAVHAMTGIDPDKKICLILCVGYAGEKDVPRDKVRKDLSEIVTFL